MRRMQAKDLESSCANIVKGTSHLQRRDYDDSSVVTEARSCEDYDPLADKARLADGSGANK